MRADDDLLCKHTLRGLRCGLRMHARHARQDGASQQRLRGPLRHSEMHLNDPRLARNLGRADGTVKHDKLAIVAN